MRNNQEKNNEVILGAIEQLTALVSKNAEVAANNNVGLQETTQGLRLTNESLRGMLVKINDFGDKMQSLEAGMKVFETDISNINARMEKFENESPITPYQADSIREAAALRVRQLIGDDKYEYQCYHKALFKSLYGYLHKYCGLSTKIGMTPKSNYDRIMCEIESWRPLEGMAALKLRADEAAEARRAAKDKGYI